MFSWLRNLLKIYLQYLGAALCSIPAFALLKVGISLGLSNRVANGMAIALAVGFAAIAWFLIGRVFQDGQSIDEKTPATVTPTSTAAHLVLHTQAAFAAVPDNDALRANYLFYQAKYEAISGVYMRWISMPTGAVDQMGRLVAVIPKQHPNHSAIEAMRSYNRILRFSDEDLFGDEYVAEAAETETKSDRHKLIFA